MIVMNAKRPIEGDVQDDIPAQKRMRIKLASPSPERTSESDTESIHSYQGYKTELANDTSDTTSSSPNVRTHNEFEIVDTEDPKLRYYMSDDSIEPDNSKTAVLNTASSESLDNALLGDTSEENSTSPTSNSDVDPELPRNDYLDFEKCLLCKTNEKNISYPYCSNCFKWRKNFFPPRPKKGYRSFSANKKKSKGVDLQEKKNESDSVEKMSKSSFNDSGVGSAEATQSEDTVDGPSEPSTSGSSSVSVTIPNTKGYEVCSVCFLKPENGLFVHLKTAHKYGCYSCAKEIWYQNGGCPICRRKVFKVTKLYI